MTDSTASVNERIALARGWKKGSFNELHEGKGFYWWWPPSNDSAISGTPDFLGEWDHAGPLYMEMLVADLCEQQSPFRTTKDGWCVTWHSYATGDTFESVGDTLTEAIGNAWLAWKEGEG